MKRTNSTYALALLFLAACGSGEEESNVANNADNAQSTEGTCADGDFDALQPLTEYPQMPLSFEYPEGWTVSDLETDFAYEGAISRRTSVDFPGYVQLTYSVRKDPVADADNERQNFETQGREVLRTIEFGDEMVEIYTLPEDPVVAVDAAFVFPAGGDFYYAEFNANAPPDECLEERRALRTAVLDSLAPAP